MNKKSYKKKTFAEKAYQSTRVDYSTTQARIQRMLEELNITSVRITQNGTDYVVDFIVKLKPDEAPRRVRINVPIISELGDSFKKSQHRRDAIFRVLFYHLKNRFVAVSNGLREFEEEFMSDIVVIVNGEEQRLGDIIVPEIKRQLKGSDKVILKIQQ